MLFFILKVLLVHFSIVKTIRTIQKKVFTKIAKELKQHYLLDSKNILTILNVEGNPIYWLGDQLWYERLFDNIISNIYKHSNSSRITIYLNENYITIQDNGIGFNDMSTKSKGLTIIKDICERFTLKLNIVFRNLTKLSHYF